MVNFMACIFVLSFLFCCLGARYHVQADLKLTIQWVLALNS